MPEPTVTLTLRFDPDLYARAKAQARAEGMSLNAWVNRAAEEKLDRKGGESYFEREKRKGTTPLDRQYQA